MRDALGLTIIQLQSVAKKGGMLKSISCLTEGKSRKELHSDFPAERSHDNFNDPVRVLLIHQGALFWYCLNKV